MLKYEGEYDFFDEKYPGFIQWYVCDFFQI